jgi:hypothetical protein
MKEFAPTGVLFALISAGSAHAQGLLGETTNLFAFLTCEQNARCRADPPEGDARHSDDRRRTRALVEGAVERYFVVRGRLWRCTNPSLRPDDRTRLTADLMKARRAVGVARKKSDHNALSAAGAAVNGAERPRRTRPSLV